MIKKLNFRYKITSILIILTFLITLLHGCDGIFPSQNKPTVPSDHSDNISGAFHKPDPTNTEDCTECHGSDLKGGVAEVNGQFVYTNSCYQCHSNLWNRNGGGGGGIIKKKIIK